MKALILANGAPPSRALLHQLTATHDLFFVTDGAVHQAAALGVTPDIISGDFDSIHEDDARAAFSTAEFVSTPQQYQADLEKAVELARQRGAASITITGAAGGRIDHLLGNFSLLLRYHAEIDLSIVDDGSEVRAISGTDAAPGSWLIKTQVSDTLSLISPTGTARVTIRGVQWPLDDFPLPIGTLGISNRATGNSVTVKVRGGATFVCHLFSSQEAKS